MKDRVLSGILLSALLAVASLSLFTAFYVFPLFTGLLEKQTVQRAIDAAEDLSYWLRGEGYRFGDERLPESFGRYLSSYTRIHSVVKAKILASDGRVLFSTDPAEIGSRVKHRFFFDEVVRGRIYTRSIARNEKSSDGESFREEVIETYVPVVEDGRFLGAFEVYTDVTAPKERLSAILWRVSGLLFALVSALLGLLVAAALIARRAARQRREVEDRLRQISRDWEDTFNTIPEMITVHDLEYNILRANRAAREGLRIPADAVPPVRCYERVHGTLHPPKDCPSCGTLKTGEPCRTERFEPNLGKYVELRTVPRIGPDGNMVGLIHIIRDISEQKTLEERLRRMSVTDELTGLLNRRGFFQVAGRQLAVAGRSEEEAALFYADLDNMKWINDTLGHEEGDRALRDAADLFREVFRKTDIVGRIGGDEFAIFMVKASEYNAEKRLRVRFDAFNRLGERPYRLDLSLGMVRFDPSAPLELEELLKEADRRMYREKLAKKDAKGKD